MSARPVWVDIHAHLFNGYDLPVRAFAREALHLPSPIAWAIERYAKPAPALDVDREQLEEWISNVPLAGLDLPRRGGGDNIILKISRYVHMFNQARGTRLAMLRELDGLGRVAAQTMAKLQTPHLDTRQLDDHVVDLFVPLAVDLEPGVGGKALASPRDQHCLLELMSEASLLGVIPHFDGIVLPMAGFDPRRQDGCARNDFGDVRERVCSGRAVGVKLYPPMGFRPIGNERDVDERLWRLYTWCTSEDVPIVAHCSPANAVDHADMCAHPNGWRPVLHELPDLRLALAHSGGTNDPDDHWLESAMGVVAQYPNVYADVSNHDHISRGPQFVARMQACAEELGRDFLRKVMFGSDYWFLYMHRDPQGFLADYVRLIGRLLEPAEVHRFEGGAALELLGFDDEGNANRLRVLRRMDDVRAAHSVTTPLPDSFIRIMTPQPTTAPPSTSPNGSAE